MAMGKKERESSYALIISCMIREEHEEAFNAAIKMMALDVNKFVSPAKYDEAVEIYKKSCTMSEKREKVDCHFCEDYNEKRLKCVWCDGKGYKWQVTK